MYRAILLDADAVRINPAQPGLGPRIAEIRSFPGPLERLFQVAPDAQALLVEHSQQEVRVGIVLVSRFPEP